MKLQDLTNEQLELMSDDQLAQLEWENGGSGILPFGTRARYLEDQTKHLVRAYIKDGELGVDFKNLETPRFADDSVKVQVSNETMEELKGDNWIEAVREILNNN